jgi:hypothetical protein
MSLFRETNKLTHSSLIQLPTETPPQLMPCTKLFAMLSRLCLASWPRLLALFMAIGLAPAKESCRDLPMLLSKAVPLIMAEVRESVSG